MLNSKLLSSKWVVFFAFLALIFLPKQMPVPSLKWGVIAILGAICLLFEFSSLKNSTPSETKQTWLLIVLTIALIAINFMI